MSIPNYDTLPALAPPPGVTPNLVSPHTDAPFDIGWSLTCFALGTFGVWARLFTKSRIMRKIQVEDYALTVSWLGWIAFLGVAWAASNIAGGRHQWDVSVNQLIAFVWLSNDSIIVYLPAVYFARLSVVIQLQRIFSGSQKGFVYWAFYAIHAANLVYYVVNLFVTIFPCMPRARLTNPSIPGTCIDFNASFVAGAAFGLATDIATMALPLYAIRRLKMARKQKWGVSVIFATGVLACVASVLRTYYSVRLYFTSDITFAYGPLGVVTSIEFGSLMLVACFPVMPRLYRHVRDKFRKPKSTSQYTQDRCSVPSAYVQRKSLREDEIILADITALPRIPEGVWLDLENPSHKGEARSDNNIGEEDLRPSLNAEARGRQTDENSLTSTSISAVQPTDQS